MARSPIRGVDPTTTEPTSGAQPAPNLTKPAEIEATQNEDASTTLEVSDSAPADEVISDSSEAEEQKASASADASSDDAPEPAKAPLKKPLGLSLRKAPAEVKPPPSNKMQIDGAIELTLSAANTAVDAAQEIQRLRAELEIVTASSRHSGKLLLFACLLISACATAGLTGALIFYQRSFTDFQALAKINRDVLMSFAGEVKGLTITSKTIEESVNLSAQALSASSTQTEEIRKAIQSFTAAQKTLEAKIAPASAYEKQFSGLKQPLDQLATLNETINSRLIEIEKARQAREAARKPVAEAPKIEAPKAPAKPEASAQTKRENLVRFP